jgi:hypothetical protein
MAGAAIRSMRQAQGHDYTLEYDGQRANWIKREHADVPD